MKQWNWYNQRSEVINTIQKANRELIVKQLSYSLQDQQNDREQKEEVKEERQHRIWYHQYSIVIYFSSESIKGLLREYGLWSSDSSSHWYTIKT
jgi:hypothetical protein